MKKIKINPKKVIRTNPRMEEEGPDVGLLFVMIFGLLLGMALVSLTSCGEQKPQKETLSEITGVTEYTYQGCEYIKIGNADRQWGSHKGNCKNPIHKK
jgi:hypothetical protein